jgi:hypothetical protein
MTSKQNQPPKRKIMNQVIHYLGLDVHKDLRPALILVLSPGEETAIEHFNFSGREPSDLTIDDRGVNPFSLFGRPPSSWPSPSGEGTAFGRFRFANSCPANPVACFPKTRGAFPPLLGGEGRGEVGQESTNPVALIAQAAGRITTSGSERVQPQKADKPVRPLPLRPTQRAIRGLVSPFCWSGKKVRCPQLVSGRD